jgi:nucleotide-binding universal stress UspA family protein
MKINRIVVGVDLCEPSVTAARWTALEFAPDADIVLLHVVDLPRPPRVVRGAMAPMDRVLENAVVGARARLAELGPWVDETRVVTEVVVGSPADRLVEAVDTHAADLLVVGEHGCQRGVWEFLGTTAEHVVQRASVPVLVARGLPPGQPRRILAAVDQSSFGRRALSWASFLGRHLGAKVVALHALEPVVHAPLELVGIMPIAEIQEDLRVEAERWLGEEAREAGAQRELAECRVAVGEPVHEILEAIEQEQADLIVIGSRGIPSPLGGMLGSVARAVLRHTSSPVLVVGPLGR